MRSSPRLMVLSGSNLPNGDDLMPGRLGST